MPVTPMCVKRVCWESVPGSSPLATGSTGIPFPALCSVPGSDPGAAQGAGTNPRVLEAAPAALTRCSPAPLAHTTFPASYLARVRARSAAGGGHWAGRGGGARSGRMRPGGARARGRRGRAGGAGRGGALPCWRGGDTGWHGASSSFAPLASLGSPGGAPGSQRGKAPHSWEASVRDLKALCQKLVLEGVARREETRSPLYPQPAGLGRESRQAPC